ncbi:TPA: hypothetical protein ACIIGB_004996, partial [Salmonella enterica subsp. enterica serovar Typhimurium]
TILVTKLASNPAHARRTTDDNSERARQSFFKIDVPKTLKVGHLFFSVCLNETRNKGCLDKFLVEMLTLGCGKTPRQHRQT